jgi:DNA primase
MADSTIQEIKDRLNIAEVIGGYIQVKKAGSAFKALCPFHHEKTPSMQISPQKQIWHCFGCGEGGDVLSFVQKYENLEFKETLRLLADRAGVQLPNFKPEDRQKENEKDILYRINDFASRFYHEVLFNDKKGIEALEYLKKRALTAETIKQWRIGYAPEDFHSLEMALGKKGVNNKDAINAGVLIKNDRGQIYDRFRGRITFPIFDLQNRVLGFSARILPKLDDGKTGKYINSPQTLIYDKSKVLFGLNFAKLGLRKTGECLIVEGQMDCISAHQSGIDNAVASSGTALTENQLDILSRFTKNLKFCFDADVAGLIATRRAIDAYLGRDFLVKVVNLGGAKDPDELIRENKEAFLKLVENAPLFLDYYLDKAFLNFNAKSVEQKKNIAKDVLPLVKALIDPVEQDHYIRLIADKMNIQESAVRASLASIKANVHSKPLSIQVKSKGKPGITLLGLEKEVLGGMIKFKEMKEMAEENFDAVDFENADILSEIKKVLSGTSANNSTVAKEAVFMVESLIESMEGNSEAVLRQLFKSLYFLRVLSLKKQLLRLQAEIKFAEQQKEENRIKELNKEIFELTALRMEFEKKINV